MFGLGKSKAVVGLDIGSSAVKAVELKAVGKGFKVVAFAMEPVPPITVPSADDRSVVAESNLAGLAYRSEARQASEGPCHP